MDFTETMLSEEQDRMKRDKDEDTQKIPVVKTPSNISNQPISAPTKSTSNHSQLLKEGPVTISKEAPDRDEPEAVQAEQGSFAVQESELAATSQAVENSNPSGESSPAPYFRSPATPRKNVIPQRRTSFEAVPQTPHIVKRSSLNGANGTALDQPPTLSPEEAPQTPRVVPQSSFNATNGTDSDQLSKPSSDDVPQTPRVVKEGSLKGGNGAGSDQPPLAFPHEIMPTMPMLPIPETGKDQETESTIELTAAIETQILPVAPKLTPFPDIPVTQILPDTAQDSPFPDIPTTLIPVPPASQRATRLTRGRAILAALLLLVVIINATMAGFGQAFGPRGWSSAFSPDNNPGGGPNLLTQISGKFKPTPGATGQVTPPTPLQIVNALLAQMTQDEKLGQMMLVRFEGQNYSAQLDAMISQYHVGGVLFFNANIRSKPQLIDLTSQMQHHASLPLIVSVDQEGGTVDRFINLDGPQPPASAIGASGDPNKAYQQGIKDARDLNSCGFNLNLGPVVDVTNVYNSQLAGRTYGNNPTIVTTMAGAYLKGLQQSGKVLGTVKHFPGLGDTSTDPHSGLPYLNRSLENLNAIDWAPYKNMLSQNNVYSIMVTHEIVRALDPSTPSSLSPKVIGILRNQLGFNGVIITDGLTMDAIMARYTLGQAAALAVEAGDDLLMDPGSPNQVAQMINGIKDAMTSGAISQKQIDDAVRRILLFKYQMGLLHVTQ